jgi:hypothetical protein
MNFKLKILNFDSRTRSYLVQFWTDKICEDYETNELPSRIKNVKQSDSRLSDEEAEKRAREIWPMGEVRNITIFHDPMPTGDQLRDYIADAAPRDILVHREKCLQGAGIIHDPSDINKEHNVTIKEILFEELDLLELKKNLLKL